MGYQVSYDMISAPSERRSKRWTGIAALVVICVLLISAVSFKTAALPWIKNFLIPGDPEVTAAALDAFVDDLQDGMSFADAVTAFCQTIIAHGQAG